MAEAAAAPVCVYPYYTYTYRLSDKLINMCTANKLQSYQNGR